MDKPKVDIIVPCYNESEVINIFYDNIVGVLNELTAYSFNFIFIDDGSSDNTLEIVMDLARCDDRILYESFSRNFGKEAAMYAGLSASAGDYSIIMDADLQNPPHIIKDMLIAMEEGYDTCVACRTRHGEPALKTLFARLFYKLINKISDVEMIDGAGDFRIFKRQVREAILKLSEVQRFSKGIFSWVGFKTKWIYFKNVKRAAGQSKWSFMKLFSYAIDGIADFSVIPLRISSFLGVLFSFSSFIMLMYIVIKTIIYGKEVPGYASTIALILFTGGITMMALGVLGEYVAKIFIEVKNRPIYIVRDTNIKKDNENE